MNERSSQPLDSLADDLLDGHFVELLAAYDELLECGTQRVPGNTEFGISESEERERRGARAEVDPLLASELEEAKECLRLLDRVWRRRDGSNQGSNHGSNGWHGSDGADQGEAVALEGIGPTAPERHGNTERHGDRYQQRRFGRFEVLRKLGEGGGGIVFLAVDTRLGRKVALKVPQPEILFHCELRERFVREAQAAAVLDHSNIVPVYEAGEVGAICYIASAYCDGPTLAEWMKRGGQAKFPPQVTQGRQAQFAPSPEGGGQAQFAPQTPQIEPVPDAQIEPVPDMPVRVAAELVAMLADAVEHAHQKGVLHRDLKPSNVLLEFGKDCRCPAPKLTDFGLAKLLDGEREHTRTGAAIGTPAYMAPEQVEGRHADVTPATDVYALGVILYEMLAGRVPFQRDGDLKTLQSVARDEPPMPRRFRPRLARDLEAICLKCLEKDPRRRYARAADLAADLKRFLVGVPTAARPATAATRVLKWVRRRPATAALMSVICAAAIAAVTGFTWHKLRVGRVEAAATARIEAREHEERERTRQYDYATYIQGAYQAWLNTDLESAMDLLDRCRLRPGEEDLRGFEWYYVRRLCAGGLVTLRGHDGPVRGVAFSPDGERLASCGADGTLRVWDCGDGPLEPSRLGSHIRIPSHDTHPPNSGRLLATIPAHDGSANGVAYSPGGRFVATAGDDGQVRLWNAQTFNIQAKFRATGDKLLCVAVSPDGCRLAAAGEDEVIHVWDVASGAEYRTIGGHQGAITSIAFAPDGQRLASGSADRSTRIWDVGACDEPRAVLMCEGPVSSVAFSPDGETLATGDGCIRLWDASDPDGPINLNNHTNKIRSVTFSPDGKVLASVADDMTLMTWDAASPVEPENRQNVFHTLNKLLCRYRGHLGPILHVSYSPRGDRVATAGKDGIIQIWDPRGPQERQPLPTKVGPSPQASLSPDGAFLAMTSFDGQDGELHLWRSASEKEEFLMTQPHPEGFAVRFSPDSRQMCLFGEPGAIHFWDLATSVGRQLRVPEDSYLDAAFTRDGRRLAVAAASYGSTRILDVSSGVELASVPGQRVVAISPDDRLLATESADVKEFFPVELWDVSANRSSGRLLGHIGGIYSAAFSADGSILATGSADGTARLWNVADQSEEFVLRGHRGAVLKVAFLLNSKSLATASSDGTVKIWDVLTGRLLLTLDAIEGQVSSMSVSADGRTLATAGSGLNGARRIDLWSAPDEPAAL